MKDKKREEEEMENLVSEFVDKSLKTSKDANVYKNAVIGMLMKNKGLAFAFSLVMFVLVQGLIKTFHDIVLLINYIY